MSDFSINTFSTIPVLHKDNTYVATPVMHETLPINTCDEYMVCLQEKDLSKNKQIINGIKRIHEETGLSEQYIKMLMDSEKLRLTVYDDRVKANKEDKHGTYTIGYGHTGLVPGWCFQDDRFENDKLYEITEENKNLIRINASMASQLLLEDLTLAKDDAMNFFGKEIFNNAPQSIQDAIVDIIFNKGLKAFDKEINPNSPTIKLKKDLENQDYVSAAAHTIYETPILGLKERNIVRFVHAVKDLNPKNKQEAKKQVEEYYEHLQHEYTILKNKPVASFGDYKQWLKVHYHSSKIYSLWNSIDKQRV